MTTLHDLADRWERLLCDRIHRSDYSDGENAAYRQCAAELRAALAETGWRSMDSAPKDGTFVHLWVPGDERSEGYTETGSWVAGANAWDIGAARQPDSMFSHWRLEFPPPAARRAGMTNEQIADELERRAKLLREARDGTKDEPRSPLATQMALAADVGWAVERNLSAILRALRAEPDAGEVERAAVAVTKVGLQQIVAREWPDTLPLDAAPGSKVRFLNCHGHDWQREEAAAVLSTEQDYTLARLNVGDWSSTVELVEYPGRKWNHVMFGYAPHRPERSHERNARHGVRPLVRGRGIVPAY